MNLIPLESLKQISYMGEPKYYLMNPAMAAAKAAVIRTSADPLSNRPLRRALLIDK